MISYGRMILMFFRKAADDHKEDDMDVDDVPSMEAMFRVNFILTDIDSLTLALTSLIILERSVKPFMRS